MSTTSNRPSVSPVVIVSVLFSRPIVSPLSPFAIRFCSASTPNRLLSSPLAVVFVCFLPGSDSLLTSTRYRLCFVASVDSSIRLLLKLLCSISPRYLIPIFPSPFCSCSSLSLILKSALPRFLQSLRFLKTKLNFPSLLSALLHFAYPEIYSASLRSVSSSSLPILFCFSFDDTLSLFSCGPVGVLFRYRYLEICCRPSVSVVPYLVQFISALFATPPICFPHR